MAEHAQSHTPGPNKLPARYLQFQKRHPQVFQAYDALGAATAALATTAETEQPTGQDGWTTFTIDPTAQMPRFTYLVMFVRARTPQGNLLAGASTRRLVQVRIRP